MRLDDERIDNKKAVLSQFLANFQEAITAQHFIVLTEKAMRITIIK